MGYQGGEDHSEIGVVVTVVMGPARHERHVGVLPRAPPSGRVGPHGWLGAGEQTGVGSSQVTTAFGQWYGCHEIVPLLRENPAHIPCYPGGLSAGPAVTAPSTMPATCSAWRWA